MHLFRLIPLLCLLCWQSHAQSQKCLPRDDSNSDPILKAFVTRLKEIIQNKDADGLMKIVDPEIKVDFDEGVGALDFEKMWNPSDPNSKLWGVLKKVVGLGGVYVKNGNEFYQYVFPYINEVDLEDADLYYECLVVTASNVPVFSAGLKTSKITGRLTYDVVTYDYDKSTDNWYFVTTMDGRIKGFVQSDYVYSPIDYRMFLSSKEGHWRISCLLAGD